MAKPEPDGPGSALVRAGVRGADSFPRLLRPALEAIRAAAQAECAGARYLDREGQPRNAVVGALPSASRAGLAALGDQMTGGDGMGALQIRSQRCHAQWWAGADALLWLAWKEPTPTRDWPGVETTLTALEAFSLHGRISRLEQSRRDLLDRSNHEVRNGLFALRQTIELEALRAPADPRLADVLGRIRALFLTYSHLAEHTFEPADVRPLIEGVVPSATALQLGPEPLVIADRQTRWLVQALHELTTAGEAPVESVALAVEDDVLELTLRWRDGEALSPEAFPVRWEIASKLVREGLRGSLEREENAVHLRCFLDDLRAGGDSWHRFERRLGSSA